LDFAESIYPVLRIVKYFSLNSQETPFLYEHLIPPFTIPDSWAWTYLGNIINLISGQDLTPEKYNDNKNGIPYITGASNIENNQVIINRWTTEPKSIAECGDLLITCKGTVGTMVFLQLEKAHVARQIMAIRGNKFVNLEYIEIFLENYIPVLQSQAKSMIPGIPRESILGTIIQLPPLVEQARIAEKIHELNGLIDKLADFIAQN